MNTGVAERWHPSWYY